MQIEREGGYFYPSAALHGAALHECGCVLMIFVTKLIQDKNSWKKPIFYLSMITCAFTITSTSLYMASLDYLVNPGYTMEAFERYSRIVRTIVVIPGATSFSMQVVILVRLSAFVPVKSGKFLFLAFLSASYFGLWIFACYLGIQVMDENLLFYLSSGYNNWQLINLIALVFHISIVLGGTILFLLHIAKSLNMSGLLLFREMAVKHEGLRWLALLGIQMFSLIVTLMAGMQGSVVLTVVGYHIDPLSCFLTLYLFLESSYSAAKDIIQTHGMSKKHITPTTQAAKSGAQSLGKPAGQSSNGALVQ